MNTSKQYGSYTYKQIALDHFAFCRLKNGVIAQ